MTETTTVTTAPGGVWITTDRDRVFIPDQPLPCIRARLKTYLERVSNQ